MSCGLSAEAQAAKDKITAATDELTKEFAGELETGKGLLDQLSGLKGKVQGMMESVSADILSLVPPLPEPLENMQDQMTDFLQAPTDPGSFLTKLNNTAEKFGKDQLDKALGGLGVDVDAATKSLDKFNELKQKGQQALESISKGTLNLLDVPKDIKDAIGIAQGDPSAIQSALSKSVSGIIPAGFDIAAKLDSLCAAVPNLETGADGVTVEKGTPASVSSSDCDAPAAAAEKKDIAPPAIKPINGYVKGWKSIDVFEMNNTREKIFQEFRDRIKFKNDSIFPTALQLKQEIAALEKAEQVVPRTLIDDFQSWRNYYFIYGTQNVINLHNDYKNAGLKHDAERIPKYVIEQKQLEQLSPNPGVAASISALPYVEIV